MAGVSLGVGCGQGGGLVGEDVTEAVAAVVEAGEEEEGGGAGSGNKRFISQGFRLPRGGYPKVVDVRGEVVLPRSTFT